MKVPQETIDHVRARWGFWFQQVPEGEWFLFVPHSTEPADGSPPTLSRKADGLEVQLWLRGDYPAIAANLRDQGVPLPKLRPRWRRMLDGLRRRLGRLLGREVAGEQHQKS
jgi:hypothetical protein